MTDSTTTTTTTGGGRERHPGELILRRYLAGERLGDEHGAIDAHVAGCAACARRIEALGDEQRTFEERISFDRFAAGVERAARVPAPATSLVARLVSWWRRPANGRSFVTLMSAGAVAAGLVLAMTAPPLFHGGDVANPRGARNHVKGGAGIVVRIAPAATGRPQREATPDADEALDEGDRLRIGVKAGEHRFAFVLSIDDAGVVTLIYPEEGPSLPLAADEHDEPRYLPESVVLTGHGKERLIALLTDEALDGEVVRRAAEAAFHDAGGELARLPPLALPSAHDEQFHRTFSKP